LPFPRISSGLILLGTVHHDPKGFSKTSVFLEDHRPDLILVEISPFALKFRKERSTELRKLFLKRVQMVSQKLNIDFGFAMKHAQICAILRQISIPYEYRASAAYAKKTRGHVIAADYSEFSRKWIETWPEMISAENIERLLGLDSAGPTVSSLYARASKRIAGGPSLPETPSSDPLFWQEREKHMASQITSALQRFSPERPVYIGGWWHLCRGGTVETIRELLGIEADSCRLLNSCFF